MIYFSQDLGNGDNKYIANAGVARVEKSVLAPHESVTGMSDVAAMNYEGFSFVIGDDAVTTSKNLNYALGKKDFSRIHDENYMRLSLGTIAKHYMNDVDITQYAVGLPLAQYKANKDELIDMFTQAHEITVNGRELLINIQKTIVLPQPIGTYYYALVTQLVKQQDTTLIIDGGHLTNDVTELKGNEITTSVNDDYGAKYLMLDVKDHIANKYKVNVPVDAVSDILKKGMFFDGDTIDVRSDKEVNEIKQHHFDKLINSARNGGIKFEQVHNIVLTGGAANLYAQQARDYNKRFIVLQNGRTANVEGYHFKNKLECMNNA